MSFNQDQQYSLDAPANTAISYGPYATPSRVVSRRVDHRGNVQDPFGSMPPAEDTPEKRKLRGQVSELEQSLAENQRHAEEAAYTVLGNQRRAFENAAEQFREQAEDRVQATVAHSSAKLHSHYNSQLERQRNECGRQLLEHKRTFQETNRALRQDAEQAVHQVQQEASHVMLAADAKYTADMMQAEGDFWQEAMMVRTLRGELSEAYQKANYYDDQLRYFCQEHQQSSHEAREVHNEYLQEKNSVQGIRGEYVAAKTELQEYQSLRPEYLQAKDSAQQHYNKWKQVEGELEEYTRQMKDEISEIKKSHEAEMRELKTAEASQAATLQQLEEEIGSLQCRYQEVLTEAGVDKTAQKFSIQTPREQAPSVPEQKESPAQENHSVQGNLSNAELVQLVGNVQRHKEAESIRFTACNSALKFREWKLNFKMKVSAASHDPKAAHKWIKKVEDAQSMDELADSEGFETLDVKIATALHECLTGEFHRRITLMEEEADRKGGRLTGRQIAWQIYRLMQANETDAGFQSYRNLLEVELKGDNVEAFDNDWDSCLSVIVDMPSDNQLEALYLRQLESSDQLANLLALYTQGIVQEGKERSYIQLRKMFKNFLEQKRRRKNRRDLENRGGRHGGGIHNVNNPKKGDCRNWIKKGHCSNGKKCAFEHDESRKGQRSRPRQKSPRPTPRSGSDRSSRGSRGSRDRFSRGSKSSSRGSRGSRGSQGSKGSERGRKQQGDGYKGPRGKSPSGKANCAPCKRFLKGNCPDKSKCKLWHPPPCRDFQKGQCKRGDDCVFFA